MSTELQTKMQTHSATEFWGGADRGRCIQITANHTELRDRPIEQINEEGYIQLSMEEAATLCNELGAFVRNEAKRRQQLLKDEIKQKQEFEKTVFREAADLPLDNFTLPDLCVKMISKLCPKTTQ